MDFPFYYKGKRAGTLQVSESGVYTLFRLAAEKIGEKMLRVSVYGAGKELCLGLAEVRAGKISFEKKLSRQSLRAFPSKIEYAAAAGEREEQKTAETAGEKTEKKTGENGLLWEKRPDGSLFTHDGISNLVALPANLRGEAGKERIKVIEGRSYMLFRY